MQSGYRPSIIYSITNTECDIAVDDGRCRRHRRVCIQTFLIKFWRPPFFHNALIAASQYIILVHADNVAVGGNES